MDCGKRGTNYTVKLDILSLVRGAKIILCPCEHCIWKRFWVSVQCHFMYGDYLWDGSGLIAWPEPLVRSVIEKPHRFLGLGWIKLKASNDHKIPVRDELHGSWESNNKRSTFSIARAISSLKPRRYSTPLIACIRRQKSQSAWLSKAVQIFPFSCKFDRSTSEWVNL